MAEQKTNAMRILEQKKLPYTAHTYDPGGQIDGVSVAEKLGQPPERVFKTLVTKGRSGGYFVFVIPVGEELDLKKAAKAAGEKAVAMIPVKDMFAVTGYVRGGCSPVGMKKRFPTFFHESAKMLPSMMVSGGKIGFQVELTPEDLEKAAGAKFADIIVCSEQGKQ